MSYWLHQITTHSYQVWAAVGPLVGVILGAWLAARWQRKRWILDNKTAEYRGILDALNSYRFVLTEYYALYKFAMVAVPAQKKYDDDIALAKAMEAVSNAFADRIFSYLAMQKSGVRNDWAVLAGMIKADKSVEDLLKVVDRIHNTLVRVARDDLLLQGGWLTRLRSKVKGR